MSSPSANPPDRIVRILQLGILGGFTCFALSVIVWVAHLIRVSWRLNDSFSGSLAISIIAVPMFLTLLGIVHYVFWGLYRDRDANADTSGEEHR